MIKNPSENLNKMPADRSAKLKKIQHLQDIQQLKEEQKMESSYHEENSYLIRNVTVGCDTTCPIGK